MVTVFKHTDNSRHQAEEGPQLPLDSFSTSCWEEVRSVSLATLFTLEVAMTSMSIRVSEEA